MQSSSDRSTKTMCNDVDVFVDANETIHDDLDTNTAAMNIRDEKLTTNR